MAKRGEKPKRTQKRNHVLHVEREVIPDKVNRWVGTFLKTLRLTGKVNSACRAAGRTVGHVYGTRAKSEKFRKAWENALAGFEERRNDQLESEA